MINEMDQFMDEAVRQIKQRLGDGYDVAWDIYRKNNGVLLKGICISDGISKASPCIYMEDYYTAYKDNGNMELIVEDVIRIYMDNRTLDFPVDTIMDRGQMLGRVLFRLVNTKKNRGALSGIPHNELPDLGLSMVYYIPLKIGESSQQAGITVNHRLMGIWGSSEAELLEHAQKNTPEEMQFFMCSLQDMLCHMIGQESGYGLEPSKEMPLYVLTNSQGMYGASCMLYDGVLEQAAEQLGSDLYVLPCSIHEVILLPAKGEGINSVKALGEMVASINCSGEVADNEVLSDDVYYYDRVKQELAVAV